VRLADSQAALLLVPGQRIDVLAASTATDAGAAVAAPAITTAAIVAADVMVVAIPIASAPPGATDATGDVGVEGTLVVLATNALQARQLAQAEVSSRLSAVVVG
jgi:predicted dinucleotide-binding enzyme